MLQDEGVCHRLCFPLRNDHDPRATTCDFFQPDGLASRAAILGRLGLRPRGPFSSANGREQDEEVKKGSDHQAVHATAYVLAYSL